MFCRRRVSFVCHVTFYRNVGTLRTSIKILSLKYPDVGLEPAPWAPWIWFYGLTLTLRSLRFNWSWIRLHNLLELGGMNILRDTASIWTLGSRWRNAWRWCWLLSFPFCLHQAVLNSLPFARVLSHFVWTSALQLFGPFSVHYCFLRFCC